jgi:hypothetical protein
MKNSKVRSDLQFLEQRAHLLRLKKEFERTILEFQKQELEACNQYYKWWKVVIRWFFRLFNGGGTV